MVDVLSFPFFVPGLVRGVSPSPGCGVWIIAACNAMAMARAAQGVVRVTADGRHNGMVPWRHYLVHMHTMKGDARAFPSATPHGSFLLVRTSEEE